MKENCLVFIRAQATPKKRLLSAMARACNFLAIFCWYFFFFSFGHWSGILSAGGGMVDFFITKLRQSLVSCLEGSRLSKDKKRTRILNSSVFAWERFLDKGD